MHVHEVPPGHHSTLWRQPQKLVGSNSRIGLGCLRRGIHRLLCHSSVLWRGLLHGCLLLHLLKLL